MFCLRQASHDVKFVLIVEDDALPMNESLPVISRLVTGQWTSRPDSHTVGERFYVKLYHPVHLQGYDLCFKAAASNLVCPLIYLLFACNQFIPSSAKSNPLFYILKISGIEFILESCKSC